MSMYILVMQLKFSHTIKIIMLLKHSSTHTQTHYIPASTTTASTQRLYIRSPYKSSYKL